MVRKSDLLSNTYKQSLHQVDMNTKSVKILDIDGAPESFVMAEDKLLLIYKGDGLSRIVLLILFLKTWRGCAVYNTTSKIVIIIKEA